MTELFTPDVLAKLNQTFSSDFMFSRCCDALNISQYYGSLAHDRNGRVVAALNLWKQHFSSSATLSEFINSMKNYQFNSVVDLIEAMTVQVGMVATIQTAQSFLSQEFADGIGHTLLIQAACVLKSSFETAFRFTNAQTQRAQASANNARGQVECLLNEWYSTNPSKEQLFVCLKRWGHVALMNQLSSPVAQPIETVNKPVMVTLHTQTAENPFLVQETVETLATLVSSGNAFYLKLCMVMNESMCWKDLLRIYGLLSSPAAAKMVLDLSHEWEQRTNNPTDHVLKLLVPTKHGQKGLDEFSRDLKNIDCSALQKVVDEWDEFRRNQQTKTIDANTSVFVANTELRKFLLKCISTTETVDQHIQMLTAPAIGVQVPEDLTDMTAEQFQLAGFSAVQINKFVKALKCK